MKYFLSGCALVLLAIGCFAALPPWAANAVSASAIEAALFRDMPLPGGTVRHLRLPNEARESLSSLIRQKATPELFALRARQEERAGNYVAAEADWKQSPLPDLADFYDRRVQPAEETAVLLRIGAQTETGNQQFLPEAQQPQWLAFGRALTTAQNAALPPAQQAKIYDAWIARYPRSVEPYQAYFHWALQVHDREAASGIAARMKSAFPQGPELAIETDAALAGSREGDGAALGVYARNFSALWPDSLRTKYFAELTRTHQLRAFLAAAQAAISAHPDDLQPVSQVFFYYESQNRKPNADSELLRFVARRESGKQGWRPEELRTVAALFQRAGDYDEAARFSYLRTTSPGASAADKEAGLAAVISLLLEVPEQPLSFANRDLSIYKNIAGMDRHPGFLNGILTVALNTTEPSAQYASASEPAASYFHRAAASRLLDKLKSDFPNSTHAADLEAALFNAYALYGQDEALLRNVPRWLAANSNNQQYVSTALLLADVYSRKQRVSDELALYDSLLKTLADKSARMPIGMAPADSAGANTTDGTPQAVRSPDYARVLDRTLSRLVALKRIPDALVVLRKEIDRNPEDPGLYLRLALFVEQNHLNSELEQTYRAAFAHFKDASWASRLARLYLRQKRSAAYAALARQVTDSFEGTELQSYLNGVPPESPALFLQVNLYAHKRFPHNIEFVNNLLRAYSTKPTVDNAAYERLLRENWFNDAGFRALYLQYLTRTGKLSGELAALPPPNQSTAEKNLAALELRAEAQSWLTEFEQSAPVFVRLAELVPGDHDGNDRAITVERSLAPATPGAFQLAVQLAQQDVKAAPASREAAIRTGEILADREQYSLAKEWWTRAATIRPGAADGYLDAATVFWDYYQYADALHTIAEARRRLNDPSLYAYEAGAIEENQSHYREATGEYIQAVLQSSSEIAQQRLLALASRPATGALVESETASLVTKGFSLPAFNLRIAILKAQDRRSELGALLARSARDAGTTEETDAVKTVSIQLGLDDITVQALQRTISLTKDPVERLSARLELAHFYEDHGRNGDAEREYQSLLKEEGNRLGVVRAAVDYQWRQKQWQAGVRTLEAAADRAQPPYTVQLRREAAEKATDSGQYAEARRLLDRLLQSDQFNGDLLAAKASTFAREGDTGGLTRFYAATLDNLSKAPLAAGDRTSRLAALRRGYILALTAARQFSDALEQYQLVINAYPEDSALTTEAARFAEDHGLSSRLAAYYEKAVKDSPRDFRPALTLARIQTVFGQLPEAIAAYEKAGYVRPDRSDLPLAKAGLQMRLLRFADAIKTYEKLYQLSYHDRQYLNLEAEANARLGNGAEALRLLRAAWVEANPEEPAGYVEAMREAAQWQMYDAVDSLFQEVRPRLQAKPDALQSALTVEVEALAAKHRIADAINLVAGSVSKADEAAGLAKNIALQAKQYLTPAEKLALSQQILKSGGLPPQIRPLPFAEAAELRDAQAKLLLARAQPAGDRANWLALDRLQRSRLLFEELGHQLENLAPSRRRTAALHQQMERSAFQAYANAGDTAGEQRLLDYSGGQFARLFIAAGGDLNQRLEVLAGQNQANANAVVERLLSTGSSEVVRQAIAARGHRYSALWIDSYTALAGLYLDAATPWAGQAFASALGPRTVNAQLTASGAKPSLSGPDWFYYAGRYSSYLERRGSGDFEEYRSAPLEAQPAASDSFVDLADELKEEKKWPAAEALYRQSLELSPERPDVYDRLGVLESEAGRRADAVASWRQALALLTSQVEADKQAAGLANTGKNLLADIAQYGAVGDLRSGIVTLFRAYIKHNSSYELTPFVDGILSARAHHQEALNLLIEVAQAPGAETLLTELLSNPKVLASEKDGLYGAELARERKALSAAAGEEATRLRDQLQQTELDYIRYLEGQNKWTDAWARLQALQPPENRPADLLLSAGAMTGHAQELLKAYADKPQTAPSAEQVLAVAAQLKSRGQEAVALNLQEYEYSRELFSAEAPATAYFGLARVRFAQKRNGEGLALIRSVTLTVGAPFENLKSAIEELETADLKNKATQYAAEWRKAEPWNVEARLALARLERNASEAEAVRRTAETPYPLRVRAAALLRELGSPQNGQDELSLLTHKTVAPSEINEPLAVQSRLLAAQGATAADRVKLLGEAVAIDPGLGEARMVAARLSLAEAAFEGRRESFASAVFRSIGNRAPDTAQYRRTARLQADALTRAGDFGPAATLYGQLLAKEPDANRRSELAKARAAVVVQRDLESRNAGRRPVISKDVTQHRIVKVRLTSLGTEQEGR